MSVSPEELVQTPGVVYALPRAIRAMTEEGEGIILLTPVYYPFYRVIRDTGRTAVPCPLRYEEGRYSIDFALLETLASRRENKALLLCSPHNPVGRVWTCLLYTSFADMDAAFGEELAQGRYIKYLDVTRRSTVCVIGEYINQTAFGGDGLGKSIQIGGVPYTVVGILSGGSYALEEGGPSDYVYIPYTCLLYTSVYVSGKLLPGQRIHRDADPLAHL